jgi:hypothetical protein
MRIIKKQSIKNIIIFLLVAASIIQTGLIWFEGRPFSSVLSVFSVNSEFKPSQSELSALSAPTRILTRLTDDNFSFIYDNITESPQKSALDAIMAVFFKNADYQGGYAADLRKLLDSGEIIYEYGYVIPSDALTLCYSAKSGALSSRLAGVRYISISRLQDGSGLRLLFLGNGLSAYEYTLNGEKYADILSEALASAEENDNGLYYGVAEGVTLIPRWTSRSFKYYNLNAVNPYAEDGSVLLTIVQKKVSVFVDNPSSLLSDIRNDVFTYSGGQAVLKFYPSGLLSYSNYAPRQPNVVNSFMSAYSAALGIINRDDTIQNNIYLSVFAHDEKGWFFGFDCSVNDIPLFFSGDLKKELGIEHVIEITVIDDVVTDYRRYVAVFETDESFESEAFLGFDDAKLNAAELKLGYMIDRGKQLGLYWSMVVSGSAYIVPLKKKITTWGAFRPPPPRRARRARLRKNRAKRGSLSKNAGFS